MSYQLTLQEELPQLVESSSVGHHCDWQHDESLVASNETPVPYCWRGSSPSYFSFPSLFHFVNFYEVSECFFSGVAIVDYVSSKLVEAFSDKHQLDNVNCQGLFSFEENIFVKDNLLALSEKLPFLHFLNHLLLLIKQAL